MIEHRPFEKLGHADHGWLNARHHFSFANWYDPSRMGWGALRVWNDDEIGPKSGFPAHPHADMEIITYVRTGAITHQDSMGNKGRTGPGDVQVMSAGSGVRHAEYNLEDEPTTLFQIWIEPDTRGGAALLGRQAVSARRPLGQVRAPGQWSWRRRSALPIRADARVLGATLKAGEEVVWPLTPERHAYLVAAKGEVEVNGVKLHPRDGAAATQETELKVNGAQRRRSGVGGRSLNNRGQLTSRNCRLTFG